MAGEDEVDRLLRMIAERRTQLVEQIAQGGVSADNVQGGYRELSGKILGLDDANGLHGPSKPHLRPHDGEGAGAVSREQSNFGRNG